MKKLGVFYILGLLFFVTSPIQAGEFATDEENSRNNYGPVISAVPFAPLVEGDWVNRSGSWKDWSETVLLNHLEKSVAIEYVRTKKIPFYSTANRNVVLVEAVRTGSSGASYIIMVIGKDTKVVLDGKGSSIHKMNKLLGFSINSTKQAESYLKFFTSAISAENGIFVILDPSANYLSQKILRQIGVKWVKVYAEKETGWKILANVIYGNHVYETEFLVHKNGIVKMVNDSEKQELSFNYWVVMDGARRFYRAPK